MYHKWKVDILLWNTSLSESTDDQAGYLPKSYKPMFWLIRLDPEKYFRASSATNLWFPFRYLQAHRTRSTSLGDLQNTTHRLYSVQ
jgi:hypothetical protein